MLRARRLVKKESDNVLPMPEKPESAVALCHKACRCSVRPPKPPTFLIPKTQILGEGSLPLTLPGHRLGPLLAWQGHPLHETHQTGGEGERLPGRNSCAASGLNRKSLTARNFKNNEFLAVFQLSDPSNDATFIELAVHLLAYPKKGCFARDVPPQ